MGLFLVIIVALGWFLSYYFQTPEILWIAVAVSLFMNVVSYWNSDKIVLSMTKAKLVEFKDSPELYRLVENLCITAGLPVPKIYVIPELASNAFATGRNPKNAVIVFSVGLLQKLNKQELEGVIGHELSHIGNRDILLQTVTVVLVGLVTIASDFFLRSSLLGKGRKSDDNQGNAGAILMVIGIVFILLSPFISRIVQLAISRKREYLADSSGALLTRYPEGLASALEKISSDETPMRVASNATAHLFICNPFRGKQKNSWLVKLFSTHPPIEERVKILRAMDLNTNGEVA